MSSKGLRSLMLQLISMGKMKVLDNIVYVQVMDFEGWPMWQPAEYPWSKYPTILRGDTIKEIFKGSSRKIFIPGRQLPITTHKLPTPQSLSLSKSSPSVSPNDLKISQKISESELSSLNSMSLSCLKGPLGEIELGSDGNALKTAKRWRYLDAWILLGTATAITTAIVALPMTPNRPVDRLPGRRVDTTGHAPTIKKLATVGLSAGIMWMVLRDY